MIEIHVAHNGNDSWSGLHAKPDGDDGPFATLERARDAVRALNADVIADAVTVMVHEGTWFLNDTLVLGVDDSGTADAPVTWRAADDEHVVLSGGRDIVGFEPWKGEIVRCDVSTLGLADLPWDRTDPIVRFELFVNDTRMDLARWPNHDCAGMHDGEWAHIASVPGDDSRRVFGYAGDHPSRWSKPDDAQVHLFPWYDWADEFIGMESVDAATSSITLQSDTRYAIRAGRRFYVRNVLEELDSPGEWYFDADDRMLYLWPPEVTEGQVVASYLDHVVHVDDASHVTFHGFMIEHSRAEAVVIENSEDCVVDACIIRNVGNYGVAVDGLRCGVSGCDISHSAHGGVKLSGGDRQNLAASENYVRSCHIHHYGRLKKTYTPGVLIGGCGNVIAGNLFHDAPHCAILLHGNDHLIEYNEIHDVLTESQDAGAFYMGRDWSERGNIIRYNCFHDIYGYGISHDQDDETVWTYESPHFVWGVYLDDNASGTHIYGNLFYRCAMGAFHVGGGKDNIIENNIMVECYPAVHIDARWENFFTNRDEGGVLDYMVERLEKFDYRNTPWSERYPTLDGVLDEPRIPARNRVERNIVVYARDDIKGFTTAREETESATCWHLSDFDAETCIIDQNLVWHPDGDVRVDMGHYLKSDGRVYSWDEWRSEGFDGASITVDPGFIDAGNDDYNLAEDSPVARIGFERIPLERIGLNPVEFGARCAIDRETNRGDVGRRVWTYSRQSKEE
jgi:hypothetical protein